MNRETVWLFVKVTVFTLLVPGTVVGLLPYSMLDDPSLAGMDLYSFGLLGVLPVILGVALYLRCAYRFAVTGDGTPAPIDPPAQLVTDGPYRFCRNPMYVGILSIIVGEALLYRDPGLLYFLFALGAGLHMFVVVYEEPILRRRFSDDYIRYCAMVPRWVPGWSGMKTLYRQSFLKVGTLVLTAGAVAHLVRLTIGLPVLEMPVSVHTLLVVLPAYASFGCIIYSRHLGLDDMWEKVVFSLLTGLLVVTFLMHAYSIVAEDNEWYGIFPTWYSAGAMFIYAGFAKFLKSRRFPQ